MGTPSVRSRGLTLVLILLALAALALLVVGCGTSGTTTSSTSPTASTSTTPSAAASWTAADLAAVTTDSSLKGMLPATMQQTIKVGSDIPYAPWEYYNPPTSTNVAGFDWDVGQALAKKLGVSIPFIKTPFDSIILALKGGKIDMIMSDMYDSADREAQGVNYVDYGFDGAAIMVKKGNPAGITNLDSLAGKSVVVQSGTTEQALLQKLQAKFTASGKPAMSVISVQTQPEASLALQGGRAVADVTDHSVAAYAANSQGGGSVFEVLSDPAAPNGYEPQMVGIGIYNKQLVPVVQKALQALIDEGAYQKIVASWGLLPVQSAQVNAGPAYAASAAASSSP